MMNTPTSQMIFVATQSLLRLMLALFALTRLSDNCSAAETNAPNRLTYDSFRTIGDKNIFNPSRYARGSARSNTRTNSQPASRVESFSLVGIMAYEKGWFAFFDGTKSNYKQALQADGTIGDYKVVRVTPDNVELAAGTNTFDLKVGMQMRREDEGDWFLSGGLETVRRKVVSTHTHTRAGDSQKESGPESSAEPTPATAEAEAIIIESTLQAAQTEAENAAAGSTQNLEPNGETDPVLLRLMQRRQELNQ